MNFQIFFSYTSVSKYVAQYTHSIPRCRYKPIHGIWVKLHQAIIILIGSSIKLSEYPNDVHCGRSEAW